MGLGKIFDWVNPYPVPTVYVVNDGVVEVWDDEVAYGWIRDQLHKEIMLRPQMLAGVVARYEERTAMLAQICSRGCPPDARALLEYLELLLDAVIDFVIIYHLAIDERTPEPERKVATALREKDTLFADHDACIRASLLCVYPHLKGLETVIRYREIKYDQAPDRAELERRWQHWVVVPGEIYEFQSLADFSKAHPSFVFQEEPISMSSELVGQTAFPGHVSGRVRILKRKDQLSTFQAGEVLVSPMTTPDFLPAMKRAVAIVTDEGGVMCHAAIVARELSKPCVIGTRFASIRLKDGDEVEVDATRGVVLLKKND